MIARVPVHLLVGCDAQDLAQMRELARGYERFAGTHDIGDTRYFRFESRKEILEVAVKVIE